MADIIDINVFETVEDVTINVTEEVTQVNVTSVAGSFPVTKTSELENDGEDGVNPFITLNDVPTPEFIQLTDTPNTYTGQGTKKVVVKIDETGLEFIEDEDGASWGNITGTLSDQTDLQDALDNINTNAIDRITVKLATSINKGQAVYISSANGTNIIASKASNTSEALSSKTLGLLETTGVTNDFVNVVTNGLLGSLNTSAATVGDAVWLGVNGDLIYGLASKPYAPAHLVYIGVVSRVSATVGEIIVNIQNGFELKEIHDVDIISNAPANNQALTFESSTSLWKNKTIIEDSITDGVTDKAPSQNAVFDALALKVNISTATTGSVISFDTAKIYNTFTIPTTADITNDLTGAKIGVVQKIYSNKSVEPTYPLGWVKIGGDYTTSVVNIIYAEWSEGSRVEYWIIKG